MLIFCGSLGFRIWFPDKYFIGFYGVILFLAVVTILFHIFLVSASNLRPATFINRFVALTGIRLFLFLIVILVYIFLIKYQPVSFLLTFLCGYFVYTVFEVVAILKYLKKISS
jgi:hypothetical protein